MAGHRHRRHPLFAMLTGAAALLVLGGIAAAVLLLSGAMSTAATKQHFRVTHRLLDLGLEFSVRAKTESIRPPSLDSAQMRARGLACYREHCVTCHGAPGEAPSPAALGMLPVPTNLAHAARTQPPEWLYYVTRKGVRMTGMPAWEYRLADDSLWDVVAFLASLPQLDVVSFRQAEADAAAITCPARTDLPPPEEGADVLLRQYACHSCHRIEGLVGPKVDTAPPLVDWPRRALIAGVLPNSRDNLARWIEAPQEVSPQTLMPDLGVPRDHARAMADFLFAQP